MKAIIIFIKRKLDISKNKHTTKKGQNPEVRFDIMKMFENTQIVSINDFIQSITDFTCNVSRTNA